jgi:hypothetical protein
MVSFDLTDGYYTVGIREENKELFTVNCRGTMYRLAALAMGWRCNNYFFPVLPKLFSNTFASRCPTPPGTPPACLRTSSPRDQDPSDATCATRDGEAPDYSRTWTTS